MAGLFIWFNYPETNFGLQCTLLKFASANPSILYYACLYIHELISWTWWHLDGLLTVRLLEQDVIPGCDRGFWSSVEPSIKWSIEWLLDSLLPIAKERFSFALPRLGLSLDFCHGRLAITHRDCSWRRCVASAKEYEVFQQYDARGFL